MAPLTQPIPLYRVDAFTNEPFQGNPAAVVLMTPEQFCHEAASEWMQRVGFEMNLGSTAFMAQRASSSSDHGSSVVGFDLRWFSTLTEVKLCGHATLAAAVVLLDAGRAQPTSTIHFHTKSGVLAIRFEAVPNAESDSNSKRYQAVMDFPIVIPEPLPAGAFSLDEVAESLGISRVGILEALWARVDLLIHVDEASFASISPDLPRIAKIEGIRGIIVTTGMDATEGVDADFRSRFFAPRIGLNEDPVTGSAHCALAPFWSAKLDGKRQLRGSQPAPARGGFLNVELPEELPDRVLIKGEGVIVLRGELTTHPKAARAQEKGVWLLVTFRSFRHLASEREAQAPGSSPMAGSSSGETAAQLRAQTVVSATSSVLSIIGAFYILGRYWYARHLKKKSLSVYAASAHNLDVTKELIHVLAYLDLFGAFGRAFGVLPTETFDQDRGDPVTGICKLQAFVITFGDGAPIAWNFVMALNLYRWVCLGEDQQMLQRKIKWYILGTLVFTLTIPTICLSMGKFGDAGLWCWVVVPGNSTEELWWMLGTLYFWVIIGGITMSVFLILVKIDMQRRLKTYENEDANEAYYAVVHNLTVYITGFIVCWLPAVIDRAYKTITGESSFVLDMLHATIVPLQGFTNAVIYGKFHIWVVRHVRQPWSATARGYSANSTKQSDLLMMSSRVLERERHQLGTASIFITTFDMNWSACPSNLEDWIPAKKDLYVFSLQHCANVQEIEQTIRRYLLRVNYPTAYRSIASIAGTAFRGQVQDASVCQMIFVNNADDTSGNFQFHAADGRMWAKRKIFSDVVGMPIRYFDASIAFVTCNLSTILSNTSQRLNAPLETTVAAKHALTSSLIQSFGMDVDRAAIDFPNLYHHTFLSGNLNYDVDMPKQMLTAAIDQALKAESLRRSTDIAIQSKIKAVRSLQQDERPSKHHVLQLDKQHGNVPVDWDLLFVKSRNSLGRDSDAESSTSVMYEEIVTSCDDGLPFTLLRSPGGDDTTVGEMESGLSKPSVTVSVQEDRQVHWADQPQEPQRRWSFGWNYFLDSLFTPDSPDSAPNSPPDIPAVVSGRGGRSLFGEKSLSSGRGLSVRSDTKKVTDLLDKYQMASENAGRKWQELLRFDQLRAALEAKEVFCGFEEPTIQFLPTYPRKIGAAASFSMVPERSNRELFQETNVEHALAYVPPAYKDRILAHSLQDTKKRMRNVGYWLCEEVITSTHKPVCSEYELEIDRFFAYNAEEAALADLKQGNHALRDKRDVREFRLKLVKLDATIWTYEESESSTSPTSGQYLRRGQNDSASSWGTGVQSSDSASSSNATESSRPSMRAPNHKRRRSRSISQIVGRMLGKGERTRSTSSNGSRVPTPNVYSEFTTDGTDTHSLTATSGRLGQRLDLVPVEPVSISTIFPLPSEDVYALQRKVYEVAHFVQNGFQSSARVDDDEESQLAYTNFRTVSWEEAAKHGVTHSAITKAVSGVVHIAISIKGEKGTGGQGVLCVQETELLLHASPVISHADPIPFDVPLTWGGKHVGYLHGDILCAF